jgi:hypothetical protein
MNATTYKIVRERMERSPGCYWFAVDAVNADGAAWRVADGLDTRDEARELVKQIKAATAAKAAAK